MGSKLVKSSRLLFLDEAGRLHRWKPKLIREDISQKELDAVTQGIVELGLFHWRGAECYAGKGEQVETIESILFDSDECLDSRRGD